MRNSHVGSAETNLRADAIERGVDLSRDSPEEVEARWTDVDAWADRRERELTARLDPGLYETTYGEDDE